MPWEWYAEQPLSAGPSWPESKMLGFRSPSHAPCPGGALSASNPAAIQFPPPQVPADKHSGGKGNTTTGTIPSHPPAPPALGSHRIIPPCQAPPHPIWVPLTETKLPEKRHPPSLRVAVADRDAVQGVPPFGRRSRSRRPGLRRRSAGSLCRAAGTGSGRDEEQRLIPAWRGYWCQPHPPTPPPAATRSRLVVPKMRRAIP